MENPVLMQMNQCLQDLVEEALGLLRTKRLIASLAHEFFQVEFYVLKDENQLIFLVNHVLQPARKVSRVSKAPLSGREESLTQQYWGALFL